MTDDLAMLIVAAVIAVACLAARAGTWRKCRCGTQYCTGCGSRRQR